MPNSLRAKISKLRHDGNITEEEYQKLINKLDGHDKQIRADEREKVLKAVIDSGWHCEIHSDKALNEMVAEQLKEQKNE